LPINKIFALLKPSGPQGSKEFTKWIKRISGYSPKNLSLYEQAFFHSSASMRRSGTAVSNERLEFLGDAILGAIVADHIFQIFPYKDEGFLTQLRSRIVNGQSLRDLAIKFGFDEFLKATLTKDEKTKSSAYGDAFEAFIGAVYLDLGYEKTRKFVVSRIIKLHLDLDSLAATNLDYKSQLQIYCQKNRLVLEYKLVSEDRTGPQKMFVIEVLINNVSYMRFENYSKKIAEQKAAQLTLEQLIKENG
jgi:ribonuclease-3